MITIRSALTYRLKHQSIWSMGSAVLAMSSKSVSWVSRYSGRARPVSSGAPWQAR
jgi:hypothetical protein